MEQEKSTDPKRSLLSFTRLFPKVPKWVRGPVVLLFFCSIVLLFSSPALAQSCPLCKTALIGQAESTLDAINFGILVLLFPPLILMSSIIIIAFRHDQD
jgi:hypothetical protein